VIPYQSSRLTSLGLSVVTCPVACQLVDDCCEATVLSLFPVSFSSRAPAVTDDVKYITYHVWAHEGTLLGRTQSEESDIPRANVAAPSRRKFASRLRYLSDAVHGITPIHWQLND
jgi:hypothetical protein